MVRLPIVGRLPKGKAWEEGTDCGIGARQPVWLAKGFAGRAGAPGENQGRADRENRSEGDIPYLNL